MMVEQPYPYLIYKTENFNCLQVLQVNAPQVYEPFTDGFGFG
jgi:hypothetical protein